MLPGFPMHIYSLGNVVGRARIADRSRPLTPARSNRRFVLLVVHYQVGHMHPFLGVFGGPSGVTIVVTFSILARQR